MNDLMLIGVGALAAMVGGVVNDEFRAWREDRRELGAIKVSLVDELSEIEGTIRNMHEVWEQSKVFGPKYVDDLLASTSTYDSVRLRLFLIKNTDCRKKLVSFYKKLKDTVRKSEGKVGTLAETAEAKSEQSGMESAFQALGVEAKELREQLE